MFGGATLAEAFSPADWPSSAEKGAAFQTQAFAHFYGRYYDIGSLLREYKVPVGFSSKKARKFDLGSETPPLLVECKASEWTRGGNVPSGKLQAWNEAMLYFHLAPAKYEKVLFVKKSVRTNTSTRETETLGEYYVKTFGHLIPNDVSVLEHDGYTTRVLKQAGTLAP